MSFFSVFMFASSLEMGLLLRQQLPRPSPGRVGRQGQRPESAGEESPILGATAERTKRSAGLHKRPRVDARKSGETGCGAVREALTAPGAKPLSVLLGALRGRTPRRGVPARKGSGRRKRLKRGEGFPLQDEKQQ